jgi:hypothetical protein
MNAEMQALFRGEGEATKSLGTRLRGRVGEARGGGDAKARERERGKMEGARMK